MYKNDQSENISSNGSRSPTTKRSAACPRDESAAFAEVLSGREFDPGSWSSDGGFGARRALEAREESSRGDQPSYETREREVRERDSHREDAPVTAAAPVGADDPTVRRAADPEHEHGADGARDRTRDVSRRAEKHGDRTEAGSSEARGQTNAAARGDMERSDAETAGEQEAATEKSEAATLDEDASARSDRPASQTELSEVDVADEANGARGPAKTSATEVASSSSEGIELEGIEGPEDEEATGEQAEQRESAKSPAEADVEMKDATQESGSVSSKGPGEVAALDPEGLASRAPATSAPVLRASELARVGEARPEIAMASVSGATTTTTTSYAALRVVEASGSADVGGGGANGSGGAGQGDTAGGGRTVVSVGGPGAVSATASSRGSFPPASVFPEGGDTAPSWVERIAERVRLARSSDRAELRLALVPKGLGQIDVRLRLDAEGLHATIVAEHEQTRALLAGQQSRLEAALAQEDLDLSSFDLGVDDGAADDEEASRGEGRDGGRGASAEPKVPESGEHPSSTNVTSTLPGRLNFWA